MRPIFIVLGLATVSRLLSPNHYHLRIGGKPAAIDWFERETIAITIQQSNLNRFAGKEQSVFTHAARLNWKRAYIQNTAYRSQGCGPDVWFTFEFWADGEDCFIPAWIGPEHLLESS